MKNRKIIVTDLDGTLLNINKKCPAETKEYLQKLKDEGHIIIIATGRILNSAIQVTDGATFANYIIANAGGIIYDVDNKKEIQKMNISKENIKKVCSFFDERFNRIELCDSKYYHRYTKEDYGNMGSLARLIENKEKFIEDCEDIIHMSIVLKDDFEIEKLIEKLKNEIKDLDFKIMQDSFAKDRWIEVFPQNISKYKAITKIANIENIKNEDIIAFGDGLNDIDMIEKCGTGVAMGNALEEVKKVADYITLSHNENGIVHFLNRI